MTRKFNKTYSIFKSPDGKYLITLSTGVIKVIDYYESVVIHEFNEINHSCYGEFSSDGKMFAVKNTSGNIAVFDLEKFICVAKNELTNREGTNIVFDDNDANIITCDWDGNIIMYGYNGDEFKKIDEIQRNEFGMARYVDVIDDYCYFYYKNGMVKWRFPFMAYNWEKTLIKKGDIFHDISMAKYCRVTRKILIVKFIGKEVIIFDDDIKQVIKRIDFHRSIRDIDWSSNGKYILIACDPLHGQQIAIKNLQNYLRSYIEPSNFETEEFKGNVFIFKVENWELVKSYEVDYVIDAKFSSDMKNLLIGTYDATYCYDLEGLLK